MSATKRRPAKRHAAYDGPWKVSVQRLFPHFMVFFFAEVATLIDWTRPYKFLTQELEQLSAGIAGETGSQQKTGQQRGYSRGRQTPLHVDLLVEIFFKDGQPGRLLRTSKFKTSRITGLRNGSSSTTIASSTSSATR